VLPGLEGVATISQAITAPATTAVAEIAVRVSLEPGETMRQLVQERHGAYPAVKVAGRQNRPGVDHWRPGEHGGEPP